MAKTPAQRDRDEAERRRLMRLAGAGVEFFSVILGGSVAGWLGDRWLGTTPVLTLIGVGIGFAAGLFMLVRMLKQ